MTLFATGLNYKTAPIKLREQLAVQPSHLVGAAEVLKCFGYLDEIVLLSTRNRVGTLQGVSLYNIDDLEETAGKGMRNRKRKLTACRQIIEAHVTALTEKLHTEEAQSPWRSASRQFSTSVLIPQPT